MKHSLPFLARCRPWAVLLLGLTSAASGRSQDPPKDQKPVQQQSSGSGSAQQAPLLTAQEDSVTEAARKARAKAASREKKVYTEEDLKGLKGGVSVVGNKRTAYAASVDRPTPDEPSDAGDSEDAKEIEQQWRQRAQEIHQQMEANDENIKTLKEDIKKNGASGFDMRSAVTSNAVYVNDKNAQLKKLESKKKELEQELDQLQEEARKASIPREWVK